MDNIIQENYLKQELYELIKGDEQLFDFILDSSLDGLWYWDLEKPENEWMNARFWTTLGYDPDDMPHLSSAWQEIINKDDLKIALDNFTKHLEDPNYPYDQIVRYTHNNGTIVWIRCRGLAIRDNNGKPIRMLGAHQDVTLLKQTELLLKEANEELQAQSEELQVQNEELQFQNQELYRTNLELIVAKEKAELAEESQKVILKRLEEAQSIARIGNWENNLITNELYWSDVIYDIFGLDKNTFKPSESAFLDAVHPDDRELVIESVRRSEQTGLHDVEHRIVLPDNEIRYVHELARRFYDENGNLVWLRGTVQDITDRKRAEKELKETKRLLSESEQIGKVGGWEFNIDTLEQNWTDETFRIHEVDITFDNTVEKGIDFYTPDSKPIIEHAVQRAIEFGEPFDLELKIITAKGNLRHVHTIGKIDLKSIDVIKFVIVVSIL